MQNRVVRVTILLAALVALIGCGANFKQNMYKSLATMQVSYDVGMRSAADLHKKGFISEEGKQEIIAAGNTYATAHNDAVEAMKEYQQSGTEDKKAQARAISRVVLKSYNALLSVLLQFGITGEPVEPWF